MGDKIRREETKMEVRVGLKDKDREPAMKDLIHAELELRKLKLEQADSNAAFRKLRKENEEKRDEAMATLQRGKPEMRSVMVIKNDTKKTVTIKDIETDSIVEKRDMTADDEQMGIGEREEAAEGLSADA